MSDELFNYYKYFDLDQRIEVRFPRAQNVSFREWGVVTLFDGDLLVLQLSRDSLPENVSARTGTILDLRLGKGGYGYCCRAIIVEEHGDARLTVRLIGEVIPDELREYYRIDAYIPLRYSIPRGLSDHEIRQRWRARRYPPPTTVEAQGTSLTTPPQEPPREEESSQPPPLAANISGSGIRIRISEELSVDTLVDMELFLTQDKLRVVPVVCQVVHVAALRHKAGEPPLFSTALRFLCIDERDRDMVVGFVSAAQLEHLRIMRGGNVSVTELEYAEYSRHRRLRRIIVGIIVVTLIIVAVVVLIISRINGKKGEIEQTYEREIKKYRHIVPWR
ncbi:PilZ-like domain-containing protein [Geobacter sulfurreducens]|uniref:PilZ-like domain-containing protein n=1 Tax=Geobacter sulfurreducens TaxID=35554 RepID=UPI000DBB8B23|nr:PilZ-like domain-containing protein [Geobacter sulfurreducens]BBA69764.1 hypothetical protein YM18_1222 [Geobacter sulfurreducens]